MDTTTLTRLAHTAAGQFGIVSRDQLLELGVGPDRINRLVYAGLLERVLDGAYRLVSHTESESGRSLAVSLSRPGVAIAGPTAARLWGFRRVPRDGLVHVIVKPHGQPGRAPWLRTYRTAMIRDEDIVTRARRHQVDIEESNGRRHGAIRHRFCRRLDDRAGPRPTMVHRRGAPRGCRAHANPRPPIRVPIPGPPGHTTGGRPCRVRLGIRRG